MEYVEIKKLTQAEEQVMQILWKLEENVARKVVEQYDEPRPAYTTVATVLNVLEKKGFVKSKKKGNVNLFVPVISKKEYSSFLFNILLKKYFSGSFPKMASLYAKENNLGIDDIKEMLKDTEEEIKREREEKPWKRY